MAPLHSHPGALSIRQVGTVAQATVTVTPDEVLRSRNLLLAKQDISIALPATFYKGAAWQLTHASPTTGERVGWNWDYQAWFQGGAGLSTYALRDPELVAALASPFAGLLATPASSPQGTYLDYVVAATAGLASPPIVPRVLYYTNGTGTEQYLALYSLHYASPAAGPTAVNTVAVYAIAQVEVAARALQTRLLQAQQTAVREDHQRWG